MLARALARQRDEEEALRKLQQDRNRLRDWLQAAAHRPVPAGNIAEVGEYIKHMDNLIEKKTRELDEARQAVDRSRLHLKDRALDQGGRCRRPEEAHDRYRAFMNKKEQQEISEIAALRAQPN